VYDPKLIFAELTDALLSYEHGISGDAYNKLAEIYFGMYGDDGVRFLSLSVEATDDCFYYDHDETTCAVDFYYAQSAR
jgi:hypothetical protein